VFGQAVVGPDDTAHHRPYHQPYHQPYHGLVDPTALLDDLDADQRLAVAAESRLVAVIAGAGSGKTRVLTRRVAYRIATGTADARHTLVLTFTREAAGELIRRLNRSGIREHVEAGTFHSVMLNVLKQRWADTERRPKTVVADRRRLIGEVLDGPNRRQVDAHLAEINWAAARGIAAADYASFARRTHRHPQPGVDTCASIYDAYETLKRRRGVIDFDDVLSHTIRELRRDSDFADSLRWRFRHVLVDEAQDLNPLQHHLVDLIRAGNDDLFLVGDPAQAIYGFNGADPTLLVDVEQRFPGIEIIRLPMNHRCTPQIVTAGLHVLAASEQAASLVSSRADGPAVTELTAGDETDEAARIVAAIRGGDPTLVRTGEVAVLVRTNRQVGPIVDALRAGAVPVRRSDAAAGSPLQTTVRQVAALGSASQLRAWAHDTLDAPSIDVSDSEFTTPRPRSRAHLRVVDDATSTGADLERRVAHAVLEFLRDSPLGDGAGFRAWVATTNPFDDGTTAGVEVLTFHASKGREWHTVVLAGVETSLVPHKSATTATARSEEGRLLYVAMTRATDRMIVTHAQRRGGYARSASPFIDGLAVGEPDAAAPPRRTKRIAPADPVLDRLRDWRADWARGLDVLPTQLCTDRDLAAIARHRPATAVELAEVTSFGLITAQRLAPQIVPIVADA
jgi:DNA helicase II / ATP-dependent DNA helicase PcrA